MKKKVEKKEILPVFVNLDDGVLDNNLIVSAAVTLAIIMHIFSFC